MRLLLILTLCAVAWSRRHSSEDEEHSRLPRMKMMPSPEAFELVGVKFLDALIKKGQVEMAKGAFQTQLDVLKKVHPEQYSKYKKLRVEDLAADAVMQQSELAKLQPKTGNAFVDMLNENGIPIASSIKGIEQAIRTQKELENSDPTEQIAKAVFEKFQQQILPGMVANMIAGKNPFKVPQGMRAPQAAPELVHQQAMAAQRPGVRFAPRRAVEEQEEEEEMGEEEEDLVNRLRNSPRLSALLRNPAVASALSSRRLRDDPIENDVNERRPLAGEKEKEEKDSNLGMRSAVVLGLHGFDEGDEEEEEEEEGGISGMEKNSVRRHPLSLRSSFVENLSLNPEIADALTRMRYRINDADRLLAPQVLPFNPKPQPGYSAMRPIPKRPRKMLPLLVGIKDTEKNRFPFVRRKQANGEPLESRVLVNLENNPEIAPLLRDTDLKKKLMGRQVLSADQRGAVGSRVLTTYPRMLGAKNHVPDKMDNQVRQRIEERPIPPTVFTPRGRHTRLRWTGATEKDIPGVGGRFILPSLDPTQPALNTAYSTQGRQRDEFDSTFKIPNYWSAGEELGFSVKQKSERFFGGTGDVDSPAAHL